MTSIDMHVCGLHILMKRMRVNRSQNDICRRSKVGKILVNEELQCLKQPKTGGMFYLTKPDVFLSYRLVEHKGVAVAKLQISDMAN